MRKVDFGLVIRRHVKVPIRIIDRSKKNYR